MIENLVTPIGPIEQEEVTQLTHQYIKQAASDLDIALELLPVRFDIKGKYAGMYRSSNKGKVIRYNPYIFAKYYEDNLRNTVPHEVAHYVVHSIYGRRAVKPHGREWRAVMAHFGCEPSVTSTYDLTGVPVRKHQTFGYRCQCDQHQITITRHKRILQNRAKYFCRKCKTQLVRHHDVAK